MYFCGISEGLLLLDHRLMNAGWIDRGEIAAVLRITARFHPESENRGNDVDVNVWTSPEPGDALLDCGSPGLGGWLGVVGCVVVRNLNTNREHNALVIALVIALVVAPGHSAGSRFGLPS